MDGGLFQSSFPTSAKMSSFEKEVAELIWRFNRLGFDLEEDPETSEIIIRTGMKFDKMDNLVMMSDEEIDETNHENK